MEKSNQIMDRREAIKRTMLLTGYALSASSVTAVMQGCQADTTTAEGDWTPSFMSKEQARLVADIAETMLPHTDDSPGAKDVYVHRYIDTLLNEYASDEEQALFKKGMELFVSRCQEANGQAFTDLSAEEQLNYLNEVNSAALRNEGPGEFEQAYLQLKQAVFMGYFSSEQVGTEVLAYDPIPGQWIPCGSLDELTQGRSWAL